MENGLVSREKKRREKPQRMREKLIVLRERYSKVREKYSKVRENGYKMEDDCHTEIVSCIWKSDIRCLLNAEK